MHLCDKPSMCDAKQQLERALKTALAQYVETMGEAFPIVPILDVTEDPDFWATAVLQDDVLHFRVSTGTSDNTASLWASALSDEEFAESFGQATSSDAEVMTHISLVWLMLHEMHHFQMGHFDHLTESRAPKANDIEEFGLVTRTTKGDTTRLEASLIHEMQADHDATEMLLDAYSTEEWPSLRARAAAISAVLVLIEGADGPNRTHGATHPKAATRIFQLLGHVIDMPMLSMHLKPNLSTDSQHQTYNPAEKQEQEQDRYAVQVVVPTFFDALKLAGFASAQSIAKDLGNVSDFFNDVQLLKLDKDVVTNQLTTAGARQWTELMELKAKVLP